MEAIRKLSMGKRRAYVPDCMNMLVKGHHKIITVHAKIIMGSCMATSMIVCT